MPRLNRAPDQIRYGSTVILGTLVDTIYVVYLDNILIYLNNKDKYVKHVK